ncbi:MAG: hypothetical protein OEW11_07645 [Nitrospirota bacterium]|nr:hypothetical protein [Nitrospirota bacterium]
MAHTPHTGMIRTLQAAAGISLMLWTGTAFANSAIVGQITTFCASKPTVVNINDCATCHGAAFVTMNTSNMYWSDARNGFYDSFCPAPTPTPTPTPVIDPTPTTPVIDPTPVVDPVLTTGTTSEPFTSRQMRHGRTTTDSGDAFGDDPFGDDDVTLTSGGSTRPTATTGTRGSGYDSTRPELKGDNGRHKGRN